jgi:hypothetical protein
MSDSQQDFGLDIGFIDHLWILATSNYGGLMESRTPNITLSTAHIKPSQSSVVISWQQILMQ